MRNSHKNSLLKSLFWYNMYQISNRCPQLLYFLTYLLVYFPVDFFFNAIGPHDLSLSITDRKIEILKKEECEIRNAEHLDKG